MTDREFARRFECGGIRNEDFHHREHLRVAWAYLQEANTVDEACDRMRVAIRSFARSAGHPEKYHETMTLFWVRLLADVRQRIGVERELEDVLPEHVFLLDKNAPLAYYTRARLFGGGARLAWQTPDLRPLGVHATAAHSRDSSSDAPDRPVPGAAA
jgi:hypothetical protein